MKKILTVLIVTLWIVLCSSCDESRKVKDSYFLYKDYDFVLSYIVPDSNRVAPTEVFVGRLTDLDERSVIEGFMDTLLWRNIKAYQGWYRGKMLFLDDAEVCISSTGQRLRLTSMGNGVYRDVTNELRVDPLQTYVLEVFRPDNRYYRDSVTVPENIYITNFANGDTLIGFPKKGGPDWNICVAYPVIQWNQPLHAFLYRDKQSNDGPATDPFVLYGRLDTHSRAPLIVEDSCKRRYEHFKWETFAFDTTASMMYEPEDDISGNADFFAFLDTMRFGVNTIERRSTIDAHGRDDVIGNLGAYTAMRIEFTVEAKFDSCACDGN